MTFLAAPGHEVTHVDGGDDDVHCVTFRVVIPTFLVAFAVDLVTKQWAVSHADDVVFNSRPSQLPLRLLMSLVAIGVAVALARLAALRGLGRQWGVWIGCALLVAGTLGNGVSPFLWDRGVPDFVALRGGWVWNIADFEIAVGLGGGILSVAVCAVLVYAREKIDAPRTAKPPRSR